MTRGNEIHDVCLNSVGILILIDQDVQEAFRIYVPDVVKAQEQFPPEKEKIIEIHHIEFFFSFSVTNGYSIDFFHTMGEKRISQGNNVRQGGFGID